MPLFFLAIKLIIQDYCLNYNPVIYYTVFILPFFKLWLWENMFTFTDYKIQGHSCV